MNIIGISGLDRSVPFKQSHWPSCDAREYRMSQGHDAAAVLFSSGKLVAAAAQERFDRKKHSSHFPADAIAWCLSCAGLPLCDIDEIAHSFDYRPYEKIYSSDSLGASYFRTVLSREALLEVVGRELPGFPPDRVHHVDHHTAHAASAYFTSGWDTCLVLVTDGMGEVHGTSIFEARNGTLHRIQSLSAVDSIGIFYSLMTFHLGFDFNSDEYKIMGLAPYGDPARYQWFFEREVILLPDGSVRIPLLRLNRSRTERENYLASREYLARNLIAARPHDAPVTQEHCDVAAALQASLEKVLFHVCRHYRHQTGHSRLAMAGGVALNCTANGRLINSGLFEQVYIQPAAGDDGSALGAAAYRAALAGGISNERSPVPLFGPEYDQSEVERAIASHSQQIETHKCGSLAETCESAACLIAKGHVIAWFRGKMEFGPRALGNRSILADPSRPEMRDRINAIVKKREAFRPFAPAVTIEEVHQWFEVPPETHLPYMITVVNVRENYRACLPAITHVDGSARVQTVSQQDNPAFHHLLRTVGRITGREMLLNTSFNVKGQPIVMSPDHAIETFLQTGIDYLFVHDYVIARRSS